MPTVAPCRRSWSSIWSARWGGWPTSACKSPRGSRQVLTKAAQDGDVRYARELLSMSSRSVTLAVASDARLGIVLGIFFGDRSGVWLGATLGSWLGTSVGVHDSASARREETGTGSRRWLWARAGVRSHSWARADRNALGDSAVGPTWGPLEGSPIEFLEWWFPRRTSNRARIDSLVGSGVESRAGFQGS
jgi:hypothetical protein